MASRRSERHNAAVHYFCAGRDRCEGQRGEEPAERCDRPHRDGGKMPNGAKIIISLKKKTKKKHLEVSIWGSKGDLFWTDRVRALIESEATAT